LALEEFGILLLKHWVTGEEGQELKGLGLKLANTMKQAGLPALHDYYE